MGDGVGRSRPWNFPWAGMGANLATRRETFIELGGFEESWGIPPKIANGWRADTDQLWRFRDRYPGRDYWVDDLKVSHPSNSGGHFVPGAESAFFQRHRARYFEHLVPMDAQSQEFLLTTQDLTTEETRRVIDARRALRATQPWIAVLPQEAGP